MWEAYSSARPASTFNVYSFLVIHGVAEQLPRALNMQCCCTCSRTGAHLGPELGVTYK